MANVISWFLNHACPMCFGSCNTLPRKQLNQELATTPVGVDATQLQMLDEIFLLKAPTLCYIPCKDYSMEECSKFSCCQNVPSLKLRKHHHKQTDLNALCDLWSVPSLVLLALHVHRKRMFTHKLLLHVSTQSEGALSSSSKH